MPRNQIDSFYTLTNTPLVPVNLIDARAFLRIDSDITTDDILISQLIKAAVDWGEGFTSKDFSLKKWTAFFDGLEATNSEPRPFLELRKSPVTAINTVKVSKAGTLEDNTDFFRKQLSGYDRLLFTTIPNIDIEVAYTFEVTFDSGFTANLPPTLKTAVLEHVSFLYENRADAPSEPPEQIKQLYRRHRITPGYA
ncbi:MAG: head-tail connector protein [Candidatus Anammoxibacter sp.]